MNAPSESFRVATCSLKWDINLELWWWRSTLEMLYLGYINTVLIQPISFFISSRLSFTGHIHYCSISNADNVDLQQTTLRGADSRARGIEYTIVMKIVTEIRIILRDNNLEGFTTTFERIIIISAERHRPPTRFTKQINPMPSASIAFLGPSIHFPSHFVGGKLVLTLRLLILRRSSRTVWPHRPSACTEK